MNARPADDDKAPFEISIPGFAEWRAQNTELNARTKAPFRETRVALRIRQDFTNIEMRHFLTRYGGKWAWLSPSYEKYKQKVRPGRPLMIFDGDLVRSLTTPTDPSFHYNVNKAGKTLSLGSNDPKATYHQTGSRKRKLKARPLIVLTKKIANRWGRAILDAIFEIAPNGKVF